MTMMLGRSGSGKTTFLKILAGLIKPASGTIDVSLVENGRPRNRHIAYIPQNLGLVRNMTALENVVTGALGYTGTIRSIFGNFPREVYQRAEQILKELGIAGKSHRKIWNLSGGERQRVAIARALLQNPKIILADEFVSQLDPVTSMEILGVMKELAANKIAFLITTHDVELAGKYADRVIIMNDGRISTEHCPAVMMVEEILEEMK